MRRFVHYLIPIKWSYAMVYISREVNPQCQTWERFMQKVVKISEFGEQETGILIFANDFTERYEKMKS